MDIISQLQEQVNLIASLAFNTFGTLQRDAPPVRLSPNYPEPAKPNPNSLPPPQQPPSTAQQPPAATQQPPQEQPPPPQDDFADEPRKASIALVKAAKQFDALVNALPLAEGGEEAQLKRIAELQAENDAIELQRQLEAADEELKQVQELFSQATDNCLNMKKPY